MLKSLDLFSGIGGNSLALKGMVEPIAYCEIDKHAQAVLLSRMSDGLLGRAPIFSDITLLSGKDFQEKPDIIVAGFPCQDISVAGKGAGIRDGNRSGLFYQIMRLTDELRPTFLFLENVPAIRTRGLDIVLRELTKRGYDCRWAMLSAAQVGAKHKRERWFALAVRSDEGSTHPKHTGRDVASATGGNQETICNSTQRPDGTGEPTGMDTRRDVADSHQRGLSAARTEQQTTGTTRASIQPDQGTTKPNLGRMVNGISGRLVESLPEYLRASYWQEEPQGIPRTTEEKEQRIERIKRLGNSVVPLQARTAFLLLASDCY